MDARNRRTPSRAGMWAVAVAALGLAGTATAQPIGGSMAPPKPLSPAQLQYLPDRPSVRLAADSIDAGPTLVAPNPDGSLPPTGVPLGTPVWSATPSRLSNAPAPLPRTATAAGTPVWMATPQNGGMISPTNNVTRTPAEFGQGWKSFANQQMMGRPPAAALAMPAGAVMPGPRPDWSWHGYDQWNQGNRPGPAAQQIAASSAFATDMAPYMKYAHLWRLSSSSATPPPDIARTPPPPSNGTPDIVAPAGGVPPAPSGATSGIYTPNIEWRGSGETSADPGATRTNYSASLPTRPAVTTPMPEPIPPPGPSGYRIPLTVRERISEICNSKARNLVVEQPSPIRLRIAFLVRTSADAEAMTSQLAALPELGPYKVDFEVQIGQ